MMCLQTTSTRAWFLQWGHSAIKCPSTNIQLAQARNTHGLEVGTKDKLHTTFPVIPTHFWNWCILGIRNIGSCKRLKKAKSDNMRTNNSPLCYVYYNSALLLTQVHGFASHWSIHALPYMADSHASKGEHTHATCEIRYIATLHPVQQIRQCETLIPAIISCSNPENVGLHQESSALVCINSCLHEWLPDLIVLYMSFVFCEKRIPGHCKEIFCTKDWKKQHKAALLPLNPGSDVPWIPNCACQSNLRFYTVNPRYDTSENTHCVYL